MNDSELKKLYSALLRKGYSTYDIGDEDTFRMKMSDKANRKQLYDWVSSQGNFRIGDYDTYENRLTSAEYGTSTPSTPSTPPAPPATPALSALSATPAPGIADDAETTLKTPLPVVQQDNEPDRAADTSALSAPTVDEQNEQDNEPDGEKMSYFGGLGTKALTGLGRMILSLAEAPGTISDMVTNAVMKPTFNRAVEEGRMTPEEADRSNEIIKTAIRKNNNIFNQGTSFKDSELDKKANEILEKAEKKSDRYDKEIFTYFKEGKIGKGLGAATYQIAESLLPSLAAAFIPGGTVAFGVQSAVEKYNEVEDRDDMSEKMKIAAAVGNGFFEYLFEKFGTREIGKYLHGVYKKGGKKAVKQAVESDHMKGLFARGFKRFGVYLAPVGEGISEALTTLGQNAVDKFSGVDPDRELSDNLFDSFFVGAGLGGMYGAAGAGLQKRYRARRAEDIVNNLIYKPSQPSYRPPDLPAGEAGGAVDMQSQYPATGPLTVFPEGPEIRIVEGHDGTEYFVIDEAVSDGTMLVYGVEDVMAAGGNVDKLKPRWMSKNEVKSTYRSENVGNLKKQMKNLLKEAEKESEWRQFAGDKKEAIPGADKAGDIQAAGSDDITGTSIEKDGTTHKITGVEDDGTVILDDGSSMTAEEYEAYIAGRQGNKPEQTNGQAGSNEQENISARQRIPKDEQGNPLYEQADAETAWDAIVEEAGGDEEMAQRVSTEMVSDVEEKLAQLEKSTPKGGATIAEKIAAEKERKAAIDAAQQELAAWKKIAETPARRKQARLEEERRAAEKAAAEQKAAEERNKAEREKKEREEKEALNGVPDMVDDTPRDARARGYRRVNGHKIDRQEPVQAVQGKETTVKFSDNVIVDGHVAVIDAGTLQPSHIQGTRNPLHFIDEAQPKERKDKASILSAQKIAENIRPEEITASATAYTGAPTVNARGEVIQGNNRSDALRRMWAGNSGQAKKYKQYLIDHAEEFGLQAEDIERMEAPVLVHMLDVDDNQAIELGQYEAIDTESGGVERIKPKNALQKMAGDLQAFTKKLLDSTDEESSFAELVDKNGAEVLKWLERKKYISPTQYRSAFDSRGNITAEAKNDLKGIIYHGIFTGAGTQLEEMFNKMPAKAQKAILATAFRDYNSPQEHRLIHELQNSIRAYYALSQDKAFAEAKNFKEAQIAVEDWKRQYQLDDVSGQSYLPADNFSNLALHLSTLYKGENQKTMQTAFNRIYDLVQGTQDENLFDKPDNTPRTLAQAIKEIFDIDYNSQQGQQEKQESANGKPTVSGEKQPGTVQNEESAGKAEEIAAAEAETDVNPTEAQKKAGNYKKGHVKVDGYDITIENPKGSVRSGVDANGKKWETKMKNTYGYIRGTEGADGDHIDVFLSDNPEQGNVYVVDQMDPKTGKFDEHKVMYGFSSEQEAKEAYLSNYEKGWKGLGAITEVSKEDFRKWIDSSHRKGKPFAEYKSVKTEAGQKTGGNAGDHIAGAGKKVMDVSKMETTTLAGELAKVERQIAEAEKKSAPGEVSRKVLVSLRKKKAELLQEFIDGIKTAGADAVAVTRANVLETLEKAGVTGKVIREVEDALRSGKKIGGFATGGVVYMLADDIEGLDEARTTYVHERQHLLNAGNKELLKEIVKAFGGDARAMASLLRQLTGTDFYDRYMDRPDILADEILAFAMEKMYSGETAETITDNRELQNIIKQTDNEQRKSETLSKARRGSLPASGGRKESGGQDAGDRKGGQSGQVAVQGHGSAERGGETAEHKRGRAGRSRRTGKLNLWNYAANPKDRTDERVSILDGVSHKGGKKIVSNGFMLIVSEEEYDPALEGTVTDRDGNRIEGKYPDISFLTDHKYTNNTPMDANAAKSNVDAVAEDVKKESGGKMRYYEKTHHLVTFTVGGRKVAVGLGNALKFFDALKRIGASEIAIDSGGVLCAENDGTSVYSTTVYYVSNIHPSRLHPIELDGQKETIKEKTEGGHTLLFRATDDLSGDRQGRIEEGRRQYEEVERQYKGTAGWMKAPNGKPTKLTERQWVQVRTPNFKSWFGDWEKDPANASKVVDENGEPKPVKHGTPNDFWQFSTGKQGSATDAGWLGEGFYFYGNNDEYARQYAGANGKVLDVFLNVREPYYATSEEKERLAETNSTEESVAFSEDVKEEGCDGVSYNGDLDEEWVAFEPNQIKSATDNAGTFDEADEDIRFRTESNKKRMPDTGEQSKKTTIAPVVSSIQTTKIIKNLDNIINDYKNLKKTHIERTFIGDLAKSLGLRNTGSSQYGDFETVSGRRLTIRLSNHNATVSNFDANGEKEGISIVVTRKPNRGITNDGEAHVVEYFYPYRELNRAEGQPLVEIMKSVRQLLYSGEYVDNTGLAQVEEVNPAAMSGNEAEDEINEEPVLFHVREEEPPKKTGTGYKVFVLKDGKLYPPMVANPNGEATPVGVWLDADAAPIVEQSKTGRNKVKAGGKGTQGGSGKLAYRPGWHLGEIPYALQFNRADENGEKTLFPKNFVWAEVEYAADVDYQKEAMSYGYNQNGKFQNSYAGLPRVPENGAYRYRTNPNPETDPWIITGAMRVKRLLTPTEVDEMVREAGREPQRRQENAVTDAEIEEFNEAEDDIRFRTYYGGNRGYVGYSMSKRAAEARSEGRYPKGDFRKEYNITDKSLGMLTDTGYIDNGEWHHTSMYGNRTVFYGWGGDDYAETYGKHKKEIDGLAREWAKPAKVSMMSRVEAKDEERMHMYYAVNEALSAVGEEGGLTKKEKSERDRRHAEVSASGKPREERRREHEAIDAEYNRMAYARKRSAEEKIRESGEWKEFMASVEEECRRYDTWEHRRDEIETRIADIFGEREILDAERERDRQKKAHMEAVSDMENYVYEHVPHERIRTAIGEMEAYRTHDGLYVPVSRALPAGDADIMPNSLYAVGELAGKGDGGLYVDADSEWASENRERYDAAMKEYRDEKRRVYDAAPQELKDRLASAEEEYRAGEGSYSDDEVSYENDPVAKLLGHTRRTAKQRKEFARRERQKMAERVKSLAEKLHLDNVEAVTDASTLEGRKRRAKGFYSKSTGKITIVIPNHASAFDVEQTLLHEAVAHYGLRELFGEHFDTFLDNVFNNADEAIRRRIVNMAAKNGWDFRKATEEYLASLAENTDFENIDAGWWKQIKHFFIDMLHKIGFTDFTGVTLTDNELRYILWRSYENLAEPGRHRSILGEAADIAMQYELKVGNYAGTGLKLNTAAAEDDTGDGEVLFRTTDSDDTDDTIAKLASLLGSEDSARRYAVHDRRRRLKRGRKLLSDIREFIQDRNLPVREFEEEAARNGVKLGDNRPYRDLFLAYGRKEEMFRQFNDDMFDDILRLVAAFNRRCDIPLDDVIRYMVAKHSGERNAVIRARKIKEYTDAGGTDKAEIDKINNTDWSRLMDYNYYYDDEGRIIPDKKVLDGVDDVETFAAAIIWNFEDKVEEGGLNIDDFWSAVKRATDYIMDLYEEAGLVSPEDASMYRTRWEYYIPLKGWLYGASEFVAFNTPERGGKAGIVQAKGSSSAPENPLAHLQRDAFNAITAVVDQEVKNSMFRMYVDNSTNTWMKKHVRVRKVYYIKVTGADGSVSWELTYNRPAKEEFAAGNAKMKVYGRNERLRTEMQSRESEVVVSLPKGDVTMVFSDRYLPVAQSLNGNNYLYRTLRGCLLGLYSTEAYADARELTTGILGAVSRLTNAMKRNFTSWNVSFALTNFIRDAQESSLTRYIEGDGLLSVPRQYRHALPAIMRRHRGKTDLSGSLYDAVAKLRTGGRLTAADMDVLTQAFYDYGGATGYTHRESEAETERKLQRKVKRYRRAGAAGILNAGPLVMTAIEHWNNLFEDSTRLSVFLSCLKGGSTLKDSAYSAKEASVNFNRAGKTKLLDILYAFTNVGIQSIQKNLSLARRHPGRFAAVAVGFAGLGFLEAMFNAMGDDGDDDDSYWNISEYMRHNYVVLKAGTGGNYVSIPVSQFWRAFKAVGTLLYEVASGKTKAGNAALSAATSILSSLFPIDIGGFYANGDFSFAPLVPTVLKPGAEIMVNRDYLGYTIYREPFTKDQERILADSGLGKKNVNVAIKFITDALYKFGGGEDDLNFYYDENYNRHRVGFDINPSHVEHLLKGYLGGTYKTAEDFVQTLYHAVAGADGEVLSLKDVPFVNKFVREIPKGQWQVIDAYYRMKDKMKDLSAKMKSQKDMTDRRDNHKYVVGDKYAERYIETLKKYDREIRKLYEGEMKDDGGTASAHIQKMRECIEAIGRLDEEYGK